MKKLIALIKSTGKSKKELADEVKKTLEDKGVLVDSKPQNSKERDKHNETREQ